MSNRQFGLLARAVGRVLRGVRARSVRRALRQNRLAHAARIPTFTAPEELETLFQLARASRVDARVLEIGSYLGASTCYLAAGLRGASPSITCVDTWQNETMPEGARDTFVEFTSNLEPVRQRLRVVRGPSSDLDTTALGHSFDLVFIDGDHRYAQVRRDFEVATRCLAADGVVVFHDSRDFEGVSRVIGESLASGRWQIGGVVLNMTWIVPARFAVTSDGQRTDSMVAASTAPVGAC